MRDLVVSLRSRLPRRAILATLPAVVGLLPMPADALFSCPLVDDADNLYSLLRPAALLFLCAACYSLLWYLV